MQSQTTCWFIGVKNKSRQPLSHSREKQGRLVKQYTPLKHAKFRIKMFSLCETCGYLWNLSKQRWLWCRSATGQQVGAKWYCCLTVIETLPGNGYHVHVDSWYTSEELFRYLYDNGITLCGTARRKNHVKWLALFKNCCQKEGEHQLWRNDMLASGFNDKKEISCQTSTRLMSLIQDMAKILWSQNALKCARCISDRRIWGSLWMGGFMSGKMQFLLSSTGLVILQKKELLRSDNHW